MTRQPSALQREIRQTKPFRSLSQEASLSILRTADLLRRNTSRLVEPFDISMQQYNVLRILRGASQDGLPTLDIAERMIEKTPGITRLLDKLEAKKLVRRKRCPEDRRQVLCWITEEGKQLLAGLDDSINSTGDEALAMLKSQELKALIDLLARIRTEQK